jgi:tol-pal system protein YbgF
VTQLGPTTGGPVFAKGPGTLGSISQADLDKLRKVQGKPAAGPAKPGGTVRQAPAPAPAQQATLPPVLPEGTPKARYDFARSLLFKTDYVKAARAFEEFLQAHPKNPLATNARYWLGETHYVRHDYRQAARIFLVGFQKAPKGAKAPDTLLKLGMSLVGLKKKTEACATFDKLARDFPNASNTIRRKLGGERKRAGCQ